MSRILWAWTTDVCILEGHSFFKQKPRRWQYNYLHTITLSFKWVKLAGDLHMPVLDFIRVYNRQQRICFFQWDVPLFCSKATRSSGKCMKTWLEKVFDAVCRNSCCCHTALAYWQCNREFLGQHLTLLGLKPCGVFSVISVLLFGDPFVVIL